jgi:hypothetical protein
MSSILMSLFLLHFTALLISDLQMYNNFPKNLGNERD